MKFGLSAEDLHYIKKVISKFPEIEDALIFGSRAMGNYKVNSDIDLCLQGSSVNFDILGKVKALLEEEGPLPYQVDVVAYCLIDKDEFKSHIDKYGISIFN